MQLPRLLHVYLPNDDFFREGNLEREYFSKQSRQSASVTVASQDLSNLLHSFHFLPVLFSEMFFGPALMNLSDFDAVSSVAIVHLRLSPNSTRTIIRFMNTFAKCVLTGLARVDGSKFISKSVTILFSKH